MTEHSPLLQYLCDDPDCCDNGCPDVTCRACGEDWPCADWRSRHSHARVVAQYRYTARKKWGGDDDQIAYEVRRRIVEHAPKTATAPPTGAGGALSLGGSDHSAKPHTNEGDTQ